MNLLKSYSDSTKLVLSICSGIGVIAVGIYAVKKIQNRIKKRNLRAKWKNAGKDVVVLHRFPNGKTCPNLCPYVIKLESYMRAAGIKYVNDFEDCLGPKGLCPWITLNGEDFSDSQLIVEHFNTYFKKDFDQHLSPERKATVEMNRIMMEEHVFWLIALHRYYYDKSTAFLTTQDFPGPFWTFIYKHIVGKHIYKRALVQGIARFTENQQYHLFQKAVTYTNDILGDRKFFGGEKVCTADFSIYGFLMQAVYTNPGTQFDTYCKKFPHLSKYVLAMNEEIYPDWEDQLSIPAKYNR